MIKLQVAERPKKRRGPPGHRNAARRGAETMSPPPPVTPRVLKRSLVVSFDRP